MSIKRMGPRLFDSREMESGEGRRSIVGLEEGDEFGGEAERAGEGGGLGVRKCGYLPI